MKHPDAKVYAPGPPPPRARTNDPPAVVPAFEEQMSSHEWLRKYSLKKQRLDIDSFVGQFGAVHSLKKISSTGGVAEAQYCDIYPSALARDHTGSKSHGSYKHVSVRPREWQDYELNLTRALDRLYARML